MSKDSKHNPKGLKLKDIIYMIDPIVDVIIWTQDNIEANGPDWEGWLLDLPWFYLDYEIGSLDPNADEPISFREDLGETHNHRSGIVINLIA